MTKELITLIAIESSLQHDTDDKATQALKNAAKELSSKWIMKHVTLKHNSELLYAAFKKVQQSINWNQNALSRLACYFFKQGLEISTLPFEDLIRDGNLLTTLDSLPNQLRFICADRKPKISTAMVWFISQVGICIRCSIFTFYCKTISFVCHFYFMQIQHLHDNFPEGLRHMASMSTALNEVFIEHLNSIIMRAVEGKMLTFEENRKAKEAFYWHHRSASTTQYSRTCVRLAPMHRH